MNLSKLMSWKKQQSPPSCPALHALEVDDTFLELQNVVTETSLLANELAVSLDTKLKTTESILNTLLSTLADGVAIFRQDGTIKQWNPAASEIFGYSKEEVLNKDICTIIHQGIQEFITKHQLNNKAVCIKDEISSMHKSGNRLILDLSINALPEEDDGTQCYIVIIRDVTEKVRKEKLSRSHEVLLNTIISATDDIIVVKDKNSKWELLNTAARQIHNIDDKILGMTSNEIIKTMPQYADELEKVIETDEEAWKAASPVRSEIVVHDVMGNRYYDIIKTPTYDKDGNRDKLISVGRDITIIKEKRESIKITHKALNASSDMVCICDSNGIIVFVNNKFLEIYKFKTYNSVIGKKMNIVRHPSNSDNFYKDMWQTIFNGEIFKATYYNKAADDSDVYIESTTMPIISEEEGTLSYFICVQKVIDEPK